MRTVVQITPPIYFQYTHIIIHTYILHTVHEQLLRTHHEGSPRLYVWSLPVEIVRYAAQISQEMADVSEGLRETMRTTQKN